MRAIIEKILRDYIPAKQEPFAGHQMGTFFRNDIPNRLYSKGLIDSAKYLVAGSVGQGNWATVPWVCIFNRKITTSATQGVYIVYLLSKDGQTLYLTFNQGCTNIRSNHTKRETITIMRENAANITAKIDTRGFASDENIDLGSGLTELAELYQKGTIFYTAYRLSSLPSEEVLVSDLKKMLNIYDEYVAMTETVNWWPSKEEYDPGISKETWLHLLTETDVLGDNIRRMLAAMYAENGSSSCAELAEKYGRNPSHYIMTAVHAAERTSKATGCPIMEGKEDSKFWPVLFVGRTESKTDRYVYKIRDELYAALTEYGIEKHLPEKISSKLGVFDSWEIVDEKTAIKTCDKSFFEHNGSGVPKGICWFFDADDMKPGETKIHTMVFGAKKYPLRVTNDSTDRRRIRVFWNTEAGKIFNDNKNGLTKVAFARTDAQTYEITLYGGEKQMTVLDSVIKALESIGGKGKYAQIYTAYADVTGQALTDNKKAAIRAAIEKNSSDSIAFSGNDIFYSVAGKGSGIWGLRSYQQQLTTKDKIDAIKSYIAAKGFNYEGDLIENFYLSLKSKPFVILAGTSGTGKTRLVKLFAEAIGAKMQLVPVRPDWSDSSDLFGHVNLNNEFVRGSIFEFIWQAQNNPGTPYLLCLDEMNLARVEYYLSDFLSVIETRDINEQGNITSAPLVPLSYYGKDQTGAADIYGELVFPDNLYVVGTVNMDETTFPFSKKVLDRANTIEFSFVNLLSKPEEVLSLPVALNEDNAFLKTEYLYLRDCGDSDLIDTICFNLEELNQILLKANLHVGYRVRDEISFYMMNNKKADLMPFDDAFDHEIMQKILPRIQGSSAAIKDVLSELFIKCAGDYAGFNGTATYEQMNSYLASKTSKYPNSAKKIAFMMRRYEEDGFTSYWL